MEVIYAECEFCGQKHPVYPTPFGVYCKECFEIMRDECERAIDAIDREVELCQPYI